MSRPSGEQFVIVADGTTATITEIGATLREFSVDDRPVLWGFSEDEMSSAGRGQVLAPWPNRLADGAYRFGSRRANAPLDEPDRHNSIHGIVRWLPFRIERLDESAVSCSLRLGPQPAYPWWWQLDVTYRVDAGSLIVSTTFENRDDEDAPFALGFHPYLVAGSVGLDSASVAIPARRHVVVNDRMLPVDSEPTDQSEFASITSRLALRGQVIDDAFSELDRQSDGTWNARFWPEEAADPVVVWGDENFTHVMCFTADTLGEAQRRSALALEPMTAPPNAFVSRDGFAVVEPGERFRASWGIALE
ncbi:MAG: aldose 1-epimerase family protein [Acidimicrobiales bacterium]